MVIRRTRDDTTKPIEKKAKRQRRRFKKRRRGQFKKTKDLSDAKAGNTALFSGHNEVEKIVDTNVVNQYSSTESRGSDFNGVKSKMWDIEKFGIRDIDEAIRRTLAEARTLLAALGENEVVVPE